MNTLENNDYAISYFEALSKKNAEEIRTWINSLTDVLPMKPTPIFNGEVSEILGDTLSFFRKWAGNDVVKNEKYVLFKRCFLDVYESTMTDLSITNIAMTDKFFHLNFALTKSGDDLRDEYFARVKGIIEAEFFHLLRFGIQNNAYISVLTVFLDWNKAYNVNFITNLLTDKAGFIAKNYSQLQRVYSITVLNYLIKFRLKDEYTYFFQLFLSNNYYNDNEILKYMSFSLKDYYTVYGAEELLRVINEIENNGIDISNILNKIGHTWLKSRHEKYKDKQSQDSLYLLLILIKIAPTEKLLEDLYPYSAFLNKNRYLELPLKRLLSSIAKSLDKAKYVIVHDEDTNGISYYILYFEGVQFMSTENLKSKIYTLLYEQMYEINEIKIAA